MSDERRISTAITDPIAARLEWVKQTMGIREPEFFRIALVRALNEMTRSGKLVAEALEPLPPLPRQ